MTLCAKRHTSTTTQPPQQHRSAPNEVQVQRASTRTRALVCTLLPVAVVVAARCSLVRCVRCVRWVRVFLRFFVVLCVLVLICSFLQWAAIKPPPPQSAKCVVVKTLRVDDGTSSTYGFINIAIVVKRRHYESVVVDEHMLKPTRCLCDYVICDHLCRTQSLMYIHNKRMHGVPSPSLRSGDGSGTFKRQLRLHQHKSD